jgi:cytochrome P450
MLNADPPRHTRLLVNKAFTPKTVEELAPFIRAFVDPGPRAAVTLLIQSKPGTALLLHRKNFPR